MQHKSVIRAMERLGADITGEEVSHGGYLEYCLYTARLGSIVTQWDVSARPQFDRMMGEPSQLQVRRVDESDSYQDIYRRGDCEYCETIKKALRLMQTAQALS